MDFQIDISLKVIEYLNTSEAIQFLKTSKLIYSYREHYLYKYPVPITDVITSACKYQINHAVIQSTVDMKNLPVLLHKMKNILDFDSSEQLITDDILNLDLMEVKEIRGEFAADIKVVEFKSPVKKLKIHKHNTDFNPYDPHLESIMYLSNEPNYCTYPINIKQLSFADKIANLDSGLLSVHKIFTDLPNLEHLGINGQVVESEILIPRKIVAFHIYFDSKGTDILEPYKINISEAKSLEILTLKGPKTHQSQYKIIGCKKILKIICQTMGI